MSVIVTFCLRDGIVMAADSRLTIYNEYTDGKVEKEFRDDCKKIFQIKERNIGILWCGDYKVGSLDIPYFLNEFFSIIHKSDSIEKIVNQLNEECKARGYRERIKWQIAGYEDGEQFLYQIVDDEIIRKNINPKTEEPSICVVWDGERAISKEIISNSKKFLIGNRWMSGNDIPNMTLEEGVLFAEEMLKESCKKMESCAEPIRSLIIRPEGIEWVKE